MIPTKDYVDLLRGIQAAVNADGPEGPGSPQPFDMAIVLRAAAMLETQRVQTHILLEIRELLVLQAVAHDIIPAAAAAMIRTAGVDATSAETVAEQEAARDAYAEAAAEEDAYHPDRPPPEGTPAYFGWRAWMNERGFTAVPVNEEAAPEGKPLTEEELTDPQAIKERMERLAGLP